MKVKKIVWKIDNKHGLHEGYINRKIVCAVSKGYDEEGKNAFLLEMYIGEETIVAPHCEKLVYYNIDKAKHVAQNLFDEFVRNSVEPHPVAIINDVDGMIDKYGERFLEALMGC